MKRILFSKRLLLMMFGLVFIGLTGGNTFAGPAQIVIVNINAPNVGFNDPTPAAPVGGNTGTTLGQQRLIAFQHAANIWSARLDSNVPIRIRAQFTPLGAGVLGSAGPVSVVRDFPNAPLAATWYHVALANKLAGVDLLPANDDINANFSTNFNFYLGLDNNHGAQPDLVVVLLHEFAHGLGFSQFSNLNTGALFSGFPDAYNSKLLDLTTGLTWNQMSNAQRAASATNFGRVVWTGGFVTAGVPDVLVFGSPGVVVTTPPAIAGPYQFGTAAFGPSIGNPTVTANVIEAIDPADAAGPATTDGCSPFINAAAVAGKIVLIERGTCGFAQKARNATNAGAAAVIIYNNAANVNAGPPGMADDGINGQFVTIPTASLRRADGLSIIAQLGGGVTANLGLDLSIRAGADAQGRARVFAPFPVAGGSSISHYDTVASRNLLMEPAINGDLTHKVKAPDDLTFELLRDVGWTFPDADGDGVADDEDCNPNSIVTPTIVLCGRDTGVPNTVFENGCSMADLIAQLAASASNHGQFVSGVAHLTNQWVADGLITGQQKGAIQSAAARCR
ncbi:MAG TPA: PA domain-containing protein [Blastocatellia bacterium]|nr:PA domain-containing protein [Blastocatellia bacterium]